VISTPIGISDPNQTAAATGYDSGAAYIVYGLQPDAAVKRVGTDAGQTLAGGAFDDRLFGMGGDGDDTLVGGQGADALSGGAGSDHFVYRSLGDSKAKAHAGQLTFKYDAGLGMTLLRGDVDGDGSADFAVWMTGDHHQFSNFVL
jgi:Ca2+-binding RTX toxin-like protein